MVIENPFFKSIILVILFAPVNIISCAFAWHYINKIILRVQKDHQQLFLTWLRKPIDGNYNSFESHKLRWSLVYKFIFSGIKNEDDKLREWKKKFRISIITYIISLVAIGILLLFGQLIFQII